MVAVTVLILMLLFICGIGLFLYYKTRNNSRSDESLRQLKDQNGEQVESCQNGKRSSGVRRRKSTHLPTGNEEGLPTVLPIEEKAVPLSVNYHFTRQCNYACGFCFHTAKTSFVLPLEDAKRGLLLLKNAGKEIFS